MIKSLLTVASAIMIGLPAGAQTSDLVMLAEIKDFKTGLITDAFVKNNYLYVCGEVFGSTKTGFLRVYDVTNPVAPVFKSELLTPGKENSVMMEENGTVYLLGDKGLTVVDASAPASLSKVADHDCITVGSNSRCFRDGYSNIAKDGNTLFTARSLWGMNAFNISNVQSPAYLSGFEFNFSSVRDFLVLGGSKLLLNDGGGLRTVDYSNTATLVVMPDTDPGYLDLVGETENWAITADKKTAYIYQYGMTTSSVSVVDIPTRQIIGGLDLKPNSSLGGRMTLSPNENTLFIGDKEISITNRTNLAFVKFHNISSMLTLSGDYGYAKKFNDQIWVMGKSTPQNLAGHTANEIKIFPVPASNELHVDALPRDFNGEFHILNALGQPVMFVSQSGENSINISNLAPGIYILKIHAGDETFQARFVKAD